MQIIKMDLKKNRLTLKTETPEDLYVLESILKPGDIIRGKTLRGMTIRRDDQVIKGEKRWIHVGLRVESIKFNEESNELRVGGKIIEAPEDVELAHHTFEIGIGTVVEIEHEWKKYEIERIKELKVKKPRIGVCILDEEECDIWIISESIKKIGSIRGIHGKRYKSSMESEIKKYFSEILKILQNIEVDGLIIAGPGFIKEEFYNFIRQAHLVKNVLVDSVSHTGDVGLNELLRRGTVERMIKNSMVVEETKLVEKFLEKISKNDLVVYGLEETRKALEMGTVETFIISDKLIRSHEDLLDLAEKTDAKIRIISSNHDAGKRFLGMGGIGGFLRFRID